MKRDEAIGELKAELAQVGVSPEAVDKKILEFKPLVDKVVAAQMQRHKNGGQPLTNEEKIFILDAYFGHSVGPTQIAKELERDTSIIVRFIQRYRSTVPIAKAYVAANAERLARRVVDKANVTESLEVLDRLDALPKKSRGDEAPGARFNIIVATPGSAAAPTIPDQKTIEAAVVPAKQLTD